MRGTISLLSSAFISLLFTTSANASYNLIDLGQGAAYSINDNGLIVGVSGGHACLFDSTGGGANKNLGTLGGTQSCAYSINNNGKIVGRAAAADNAYYACLFDASGGGVNNNLSPVSGPIIPGNSYGSASSVNNDGYITGANSYTAPFPGGFTNKFPHACLFSQPIPWPNKDLGTLGGSDSYAYSINNNNKIVGWANAPSAFPGLYPEPSRACIFGTPLGQNNLDLGAIGGDYSIAYSINDSDVIVGRADYKTTYLMNSAVSSYHACLFDASGNKDNKDLGTLPGYDHSEARSINNLGQIVGGVSGWSQFPPNPPYPIYCSCLFDPSGQGNNIDLNTLINPALGWSLEFAYCINNSGWIVGSMTNTTGQTHAFLLTPEPASFSLLVLGGLAIMRKSRV
jgi:probable HAF family extracellular repeat protein